MWAITKATRLVHGGFAKSATADGQSGAWALLMITYRLTAKQSITGFDLVLQPCRSCQAEENAIGCRLGESLTSSVSPWEPRWVFDEALSSKVAEVVAVARPRPRGVPKDPR
jgi:hypothetical protein